MSIAPTDVGQAAVGSGEGTPYWQRLFRRWFVEYNPLYLVSAMLVGVIASGFTPGAPLWHGALVAGVLDIAIAIIAR